MSQETTKRIHVMVTQPSIANLLKNVLGEDIVVECLIPPGADPHEYEPSLSELLKSIEEADIIVTSGPGHLAIEDRIIELKSQGYFNKPVLTINDYKNYGLKILKVHGKENYHGIAFSYNGSRAILMATVDTLSTLFPSIEEKLRWQTVGYLKALYVLSETARNSLGNYRIALYSPVLQYAISYLNITIQKIFLDDPDQQITQKILENIKEDYTEKVYDLLIITDVDLKKNPKIEDFLQLNGIRYVKINVLGKTSLEIYAELSRISSTYENCFEVVVRSNEVYIYGFYGSLVITIALIAIVFSLVYKIKKGY